MQTFSSAAAFAIARMRIKALDPKNCRSISLNFLGLEQIPEELKEFHSLQSLDLSGNKISELPSFLAKFKDLSELNLNFNPLQPAYGDALRGGLSNLMAYLSSIEFEADELYEGKLIVTGEGGAGKTSLLRALSGAEILDEEKDIGGTTWGVERGTLDLNHPEKEHISITLNTWDFGGQEIYNATHQFFFSPYAVFLLVWNPRRGKGEIRERLSKIAIRTGFDFASQRIQAIASDDSQKEDSGEAEPNIIPRAKVIVVSTHSDAEGGQYSASFGLESFETKLRVLVVDQISVDSVSGYNIELLSKKIALHASKLPDMGTPLNPNWARARDAALDLPDSPPWITFAEFEDICARHYVTDRTDCKAIAGTFLNITGKALWFGSSMEDYEDGPDYLLADTIVLDPVWLSKAFVQVLDNEQTRAAGGVLDHRRLPSIWTEHGRPEWYSYEPAEYDRLCTMMRRFDVALPTRGSHGTKSLVPQLVPLERPQLPWTIPNEAPSDRVVRISCELEHEAEEWIYFLIAALEPYHAYEEDEKGLFWQEGVFLRDQSSFDNEALIESHGRGKQSISISVCGDQPGFLLDTIIRSLNDVLSFWRGLGWKFYINCPSKFGREHCEGRFRFDVLQRRLKGNLQLDCHYCDRRFSADELLHGVVVGSDSFEAQGRLSFQVAYLYHGKKYPCPRVFLIKPIDASTFRPKTWAAVAKARFQITLISELSGKKVASAEFVMQREWVKWFAPVARVASGLLSGLAVPLEGAIASDLANASDTLGQISEVGFSSGDISLSADAPKMMPEHLARFYKLLVEIGLDPKDHSMDLAPTRDGRWLWMTGAEVEAHTKTQATLFDIPI